MPTADTGVNSIEFFDRFHKTAEQSSCVMWVTVSVCVTESHGSNSKPSITSDCAFQAAIWFGHAGLVLLSEFVSASLLMIDMKF